MPESVDTRDRVIRLEAEMDNVERTMASVEKKVDAMYEVLTQAKGARWLLLGTATMLGFAASFLKDFFHNH